MSRPIPFLSCVVPAYNEAENLKLFIPALAQTLEQHHIAFELIVVDDGSRDNTLDVLRGMVSQYNLKVIEFSRNFGKESALSAGLEHSTGNVVLLIDADFQHPLDMIAPMLDLWKSGYDMVYGIRDRQTESPLKRQLTHWFYWMLNKSSTIDIPMHAGDFRLMDGKVVKALCDLPERTRYMKGLYAWVGFRSIGVHFAETQRQHGKSSFNWKALMSLAISGFTAFSDLPLRLCAFVGGILSMLAMGYGGWIVLETLIEGVHVPGWATLAAGMAFLGGIQLLFIGVLGEYVSRIYHEVKARPKYIVANQYSQAESIAARYIQQQAKQPVQTSAKP